MSLVLQMLAVVPREEEWAVGQMADLLPGMTRKELYNVHAYLVRKQVVRRVGYGRYKLAALERVGPVYRVVCLKEEVSLLRAEVEQLRKELRRCVPAGSVVNPQE